MALLESLRVPRRRAADARRGHPWRWLALGMAVIAITTVTALPASWLANAVAERSQQRVLLADAQGTLWQGSATLALSAGTGSETATALPGRLQWSVAFWPLLSGTARIVLNHTEAMAQPVEVRVTPLGWQAQAGAARLPATLLEGIGAPFNTLRPDGRMRIDWTAMRGRFVTGGGEPAGLFGHLTVRIEQVSSAVSRLRPLGSYRAEIDWTGATGTLTLTTTEGPLHLAGTGRLGGKARFEGTAHADADAATPLAPLLSLLGRREDNVTRLQF